MSLFFSNEQEMERQRRENTHDEEERLVIIGNGYSGDPYADDNHLWVRDIGGAGESGYNVPGIAYRVLAGGTVTPEIDKQVWIKWRKGPREWQVEMSDPDHMQQTGRSMHMENPSDPHNQFITTSRLMPLLSKPIGGGEVNVQGYAYVYDGVYREYKGTSSVAGTHVDLITLKPATASHRQYVVLAYNYAEFALGNNPIETFVSTSQTGDLDRTDVQECIAQMDLAVSRPIWAYRVDNAWTAADIVGHADDRDLRGWLNELQTIAALSPLTTKGDLFTYSTVNDRLPVGAVGTLVTPDPSAATGLKYETFANVVNPVLLAPGPIGSTTPNTIAGTIGSLIASDAATNTPTTVITLGHNTSGTPAAGYGTKLLFQGESSTTPDVDMAGIRSVWTTATHASRVPNLIFSLFNSSGVETDMLTLTPTGASVAGLFSAKHTTDAPTLGSEIITNGTFTGSLTGWTGTNWAHSSDKALHTTGSTAALTQSGRAIVLAQPYVVTVTVSGRTAGSVTPGLGAATGTAISTNVTSTQVMYGSSTGSVSFVLTPTTDFDGSVDDVSVKAIVAWVAPFTLLSSAGASVYEVKATTSNMFQGANSGRWIREAQGGINNTSMGQNTLQNITTASGNTAMGASALFGVTTGISNTAVGGLTLQNLTTGAANTGIGFFSLSSVTTGGSNMSLGFGALGAITTQSNNTAIGREAGGTATTANGIYIGYRSGYYETSDNRLHISNQIGSNSADSIAKAIIYGVMNAAPASQTLQFNAAVTIPLSTANTSTPATALTIGANSTGTVAAGLGASILFQSESSTNDNQNTGSVDSFWITHTHASRAGAATLNGFYTTTKQEGFRVEGDTGGVKISMYAVAAVARQTVTGSRASGAALADLLTKLANTGIIIDESSA